MNTSRMNERITFFSKTAGQNEDGEVVDTIREDIYSCWAEVLSSSVRDFKTASGLESGKATKNFGIRYHPHPPFDNSMYVEHRGTAYKIIELEADHANKGFILVKTTAAE